MKRMLGRASSFCVLLALTASGLYAQETHDGPEAQAERYLAVVEQAAAELGGPQETVWRELVEAEREDLGQALEWFIANQDGWTALRFFSAVAPFWDPANAKQGSAFADRVLALPDAQADAPERVKSLYYGGVFAFRQGDQEAARTLTEEGLALARRIGDRPGEAMALAGLARIGLRDEAHEDVERFANASMAIAREIQDGFGELRARHMLAYSHSMREHDDRAATLFAENLQRAKEIGAKSAVVTETGNLAAVELRRGNLTHAKELTQEYVQLGQELGKRIHLLYALLTFAEIETYEEQPERAARLLGATEKAFETFGINMDPGAEKSFDENVSKVRSRMNAERFDALRAEGHMMSVDEAIAFALEE